MTGFEGGGASPEHDVRHAEDDRILRETGITQLALDTLEKYRGYMIHVPEDITADNTSAAVTVEGTYYIDEADGSRTSEAVLLRLSFPYTIMDGPMNACSGVHFTWHKERASIGNDNYESSLSDEQQQALAEIVARKKATLPFVPGAVEPTIQYPKPTSL